MTILRGDLPADNFTMIPNAWLRDPKISAKAKGILCYIASHAAGYTLTIRQIQQEMVEAETAIRNGLDELEDHGYLTKVRQRGDGGKLGAYLWTIGKTAAHDQTTSSRLDDPGLMTQAGPPRLDNVVTKKTTEEKTTTTEKTTPESPSASPRGTRLPKDWTPSDALLTWFVTELVPGERWSPASRVACRREHQQFADYWTAATGRTASKRDWEAAWRYWMRKAFARRSPDAPVSGPPANGPKLFEELREERTEKRRTRSQLIDEAMDRLKAEQPELSIAEVVRTAAELVDAHLKVHPDVLNVRTPTGYIDGDVIDTASREVTAK